MMFKNTFFPIIIGIVLTAISCGNFTKQEAVSQNLEANCGQMEVEIFNQKTGNLNKNDVEYKIKDMKWKTPIVGANQVNDYLKFLLGKKVGIVANQTSVIFKEIAVSQKGSLSADRQTQNNNYVHLVDSLVSLKIDVKKVYAPEHGFRGTADAGEHIQDGLDKKTGIPIISLYGDNKKPKPEQLKGIDLMIFDLQDVGVRFYTYISTLHYVMEACSEANIPMIILDRPNPNGAYVDGPVLEKEYSSFVGMHPIPVVHGMTIGEYAQMINGEKWLKNGAQCALTIIPVKNYSHQINYSIPIKPSPNLPNDTAINLYPSLCLFEGTNVSVGRGTNKQFQIYGSPFLDQKYYTFKFKPQPNEGAKTPLFQGKFCFGEDLSALTPLNSIHLNWLIEAYNHSADKKVFFNDFFVKLAGTKKLRQQIEQGMSEEAIKITWQKDLDTFKTLRKKYLIYD